MERGAIKGVAMATGKVREASPARAVWSQRQVRTSTIGQNRAASDGQWETSVISRAGNKNCSVKEEVKWGRMQTRGAAQRLPRTPVGGEQVATGNQQGRHSRAGTEGAGSWPSKEERGRQDREAVSVALSHPVWGALLQQA